MNPDIHHFLYQGVSKNRCCDSLSEKLKQLSNDEFTASIAAFASTTSSLVGAADFCLNVK
jgi:hypothetical protein